MEKLTFQIKVEVEHSVKGEKLEKLEEQMAHKAEQLGNLMTTKVREAVKLAGGEIGKPKVTNKLETRKKEKK